MTNTIEQEIFVILQDFPNYSVSNFGNIKNNMKNTIYQPTANAAGYKQVYLSKIEDGCRVNKTVYVHRLVAKYFCFNDDPLNKTEVDHIDQNKGNNNVSNLRWTTISQNRFNRPKFRNCTSKYRGVYRKRNKWVAFININRRCTILGRFENEVEAAKKYNDFILNNSEYTWFILNDV